MPAHSFILHSYIYIGFMLYLNLLFACKVAIKESSNCAPVPETKTEESTAENIVPDASSITAFMTQVQDIVEYVETPCFCPQNAYIRGRISFSWVIHLISISFIYFQGEMASSALRRFIAYHKISIHSSSQSETKMGLLVECPT